MRTKMLTAAALTALMLTASMPRAARPVGTVVGVSGPCTIGGHPAHRGDIVQAHNTIVTPSNGAIKLQMADRSVLTIAPGSNMTVTHYEWAAGARYAQLALAQGVLRLMVPAVSGSSSYTVSTAAGSAAMKSVAADWFVSA